MIVTLLFICLANLVYGAYSHRFLAKQIHKVRDDLIEVVAGRVREVGPIEAQEQALKAQAQEKAIARRVRPAPINL